MELVQLSNSGNNTEGVYITVESELADISLAHEF